MIQPTVTFSPNNFPPLPAHATESVHQYPHADMQRIDACVKAARKAYAAHDHYQHIVVVGTGGSTLGAKMLCVFGNNSHRVLFAETVDANSIRLILDQINIDNTLFIVTSKSGSTIETLSLFNIFAQQYAPHKLKDHFICISDAIPSPLRKLTEDFNITMLPHPAEIGGRYSIFTIVALLPALYANVDIDAFIQGASAYQQDGGFFTQSAGWHLHNKQQGKTITVMLPYIDRLNCYTYWWRQLWAESLGKNGQFTTPFASLGSIDQHSQLQLWLDGKHDKSFTLISAEDSQPIKIDARYTPQAVYPPIYQQTTQTIQHALVEGTIHSLKHMNLPVCHIHFKSFTTRELGMLVMHGLAEITVLAKALDINPFDQPAVETGKTKARQLLTGA